MDKKIFAVLDAIESKGFEAYIVGGYVRDYLRGVASMDIDIATSALPKDLNEIFSSGTNGDYGSYKIITNKYNFEITTYREEIKYENRRPIETNYVNNLLTDIKRRDFTINSLCMNKEGNIIDLLNAADDIKNKKIKVIGNPKEKLTEDPLRMLRAIRFGVTLDFNIEEDIINFIKTNKQLINTLSKERIKYELECILTSKNALKGLDLLKELNLLDILGISYDKVIYIEDLLGMWAQIEVAYDKFFCKDEKKKITAIKELLKLGKIDNFVLFKHGLYICQVAGRILEQPLVEINEMYENLPIKSIAEINISADEILKLFNLKPSKIITEIYNDLKKSILNHDIINEKKVIYEYLKQKEGSYLEKTD